MVIVHGLASRTVQRVVDQDYNTETDHVAILLPCLEAVIAPYWEMHRKLEAVTTIHVQVYTFSSLILCGFNDKHFLMIINGHNF